MILREPKIYMVYLKMRLIVDSLEGVLANDIDVDGDTFNFGLI